MDSVTQLAGACGAVVAVTGSHGGAFSARVALARGSRAAVFNDAGVGKDRAGVAGLDLLAEVGTPAVTVDHTSARIGNGRDSLTHGIVSVANAPAILMGIEVGMSCAETVQLLRRAPDPPLRPSELDGSGGGSHMVSAESPSVWTFDSASLVSTSHNGCLAITGSHGALLGTEALSVAEARPLLMVFNDAGGGPNGAGRSRLPALDRLGVAAATVTAASARIGDGRSTLDEGVLSHANVHAQQLGAAIGLPVRTWVETLTVAKQVRQGWTDERRNDDGT